MRVLGIGDTNDLAAMYLALQQRSLAATPRQDMADPDLLACDTHLQQLPAEARSAAVIAAMGPALHWTPVGLHATQLFASEWPA